MTDEQLISQPEPEHIAHATLALARVLAGSPDRTTRLAAAAAVAVLGDVHPPYPPHPQHLEPMDAATGISEARAALLRAARDARTPAEAIRIAHGARELADVDPAGAR